MITERFKSYRRLSKTLPGLRFRNGGKELVLKGKAVYKVLAVGEEMPASKEYAIGTVNFSRILSAWESLAVNNSPTQGSDPGSADPQNMLSDAFLATMVALRNTLTGESSRAGTSIGGLLWYRQRGTGALMERDRQYFEDVEYCMMLGLIDDSGFRAELHGRYHWYVRDFENAVYGRKLCVTKGGSLGLGEPTLQPGDDIVFLPGSLYPFAVPISKGMYLLSWETVIFTDLA